MGIIRIGISACLLGMPVRYDGKDKRQDELLADLVSLVEWVAVCPEVECGLGIPREKMGLKEPFVDRQVEPVGSGCPQRPMESPRLVMLESSIDHTERLRSWARRRLDELVEAGLQGFILKSRSPSCGLKDVPIFGPNGGVSRNGAGLFAEMLVERFACMPVEEEVCLTDADERRRFMERVNSYK